MSEVDDILGRIRSGASADPAGDVLTRIRSGGHPQVDPLKQFAAAGISAATAPLRDLNAVLGAPQRLVQHTLGSQGDLVQRLGHGVYGAFHPNDEDANRQTLDALERPVIGQQHGLGQFAADTGVQLLTDPLTYIPLLGEGRLIEKGVAGAADKLYHAIPAPLRENSLEPVANLFRANPGLEAAMGGRAPTDVYRGVFNSARGEMAREGQRDLLLMDRAEPQIAAGDVPLPVQARLDEYAFVYGDADMRQQALARGIFHPTEAQSARAPLGVLPHYNLIDDYEPLFSVKQPAASEAFQVIRKKGETAAPYAISRTGAAYGVATPLADRLNARFALMRNRIFEEMINKRMVDELSKGSISKQQFRNYARITDKGRGLGQEFITPPKQIAWMKTIADAYRAALFTNPLPHMFNIARLVYFAGGARSLGRGFRYALGGIPEESAATMSEFVGRPEYLAGGATRGEAFADMIPGARALRHAGQQTLSTFDAAMRAAYMDELRDATSPQSRQALYTLGEEVRRSLGDYTASSKATQALQSIGAPFAAWRMGVVPRAMGRAILQHPERVERYARAFPTFNQDTGQHVEFSGPAEDFGKLADVPFGSAAYLASPSTIGAAPAWLASTAYSHRPPKTKQTLEQLIRTYLPGGSLAEEATGLSPYKEGKNRWEDLLLSLFGGYTKQ